MQRPFSCMPARIARRSLTCCKQCRHSCTQGKHLYPLAILQQPMVKKYISEYEARKNCFMNLVLL
eukprot:1943225-Amphidinium_carterae.2